MTPNDVANELKRRFAAEDHGCPDDALDVMLASWKGVCEAFFHAHKPEAPFSLDGLDELEMTLSWISGAVAVAKAKHPAPMAVVPPGGPDGTEVG